MTRLPDPSVLSAYLDGMLSGPELDEVQTLLDEAPEIRREAHQLEEARRIVRHLPEPTAPPDFWPRTEHRLRALARLQARQARPRRLTRVVFPWSVLIVCVTVLSVWLAR